MSSFSEENLTEKFLTVPEVLQKKNFRTIFFQTVKNLINDNVLWVHKTLFVFFPLSKSRIYIRKGCENEYVR